MRKLIWQEADFYGASKIIFKSSKLPLSFKASWTHGLHDGFSKNYDTSWLIHPDEINFPIHLVNNNHAASYLDNLGKECYPVGMPIIYASSYELKFKNNRLFVPTHSIDKNQQQYFEDWKKIIKKYNCDSICLSKNDFLHQRKVKFDFGIDKVFCGAHPSDTKSLERIKSIFKSTKDLLTNGYGSHLIYGSFYGANVNVIDEFEDNYSMDRNKKREIEISKMVSKSFHDKIFKITGSLESFSRSIWFYDSENEKKEFSKEMIGIDHQKSLYQIRNLLSPCSKKQELSLFFDQIYRRSLRRIKP